MTLNPSNAISERITGKPPFPNMAGVGKRDPQLVDSTLITELRLARIKVVQAEEPYGEPHTRIMGKLLDWTFRRAWYYWMADGPGIPLVAAMKLHKEHGKSVRVYGHCGCPAPDEYGVVPVTDYHVDNQDGLNALAETIRQVFLGTTISEAVARLENLPPGALSAERATIVQEAIERAMGIV